MISSPIPSNRNWLTAFRSIASEIARRTRSSANFGFDRFIPNGRILLARAARLTWMSDTDFVSWSTSVLVATTE